MNLLTLIEEASLKRRKNCRDCTNRKECIRKEETKQGEYCLHFNTCSKDTDNWCRGINNKEEE